MQASPVLRWLPRIALIACVHCASVLAASGDLDPAFGAAGEVHVDFAASEFAQAMVRDAAGNLFVVGSASEPNNSDITVVKLDASGHPVASFGTGGKVLIDVDSGSNDFAAALALDAAGNLYIAGSSNLDFLAIKLLPNGQLATAFGDGGKVVIDVDGSTGANSALAIALDASGNVYVLGGDHPTGSGVDPQVAILKLDSSGHRVAAFGTNGVKLLHVDNRASQAGGAAIDAAGNLVIGGSVYTLGSSASNDAFVLALSPGGQLVPGFGSAGVTIIHRSYTINAGPLVRGTDGMLYISGEALENSSAKLFVAKLAPTGQPVAGFGDAGALAVDPTDDAYTTYAHVAVDAAGNVFLGSVTYYPPGLVNRAQGIDAVEGGAAHSVVAQLDASGHLVSAFGTGGVKVITLASGEASVSAIAVDGNHVYLAGRVLFPAPVSGNYDDELVLGLLLELPDSIFANDFEVPD
ncbi:MAG: hypothetical protein ABIS07_17975 [Dokdonella sp.]